MKEITLSLAHFRAIQAEHGSAAAVDAIRTTIEAQVGRTIALEFHGPNQHGDKVASLSFVTAAARHPERTGFRVNRLTRGFAPDDEQSVVGLFEILTNPKVPVVSHHQMPVLLTTKTEAVEKPINEADEEVGLIVGSFAKPDAFIRFER